jgi:hypothetical protein
MVETSGENGATNDVEPFDRTDKSYPRPACLADDSNRHYSEPQSRLGTPTCREISSRHPSQSTRNPLDHNNVWGRTPAEDRHLYLDLVFEVRRSRIAGAFRGRPSNVAGTRGVSGTEGRFGGWPSNVDYARVTRIRRARSNGSRLPRTSSSKPRLLQMPREKVPHLAA